MSKFLDGVKAKFAALKPKTRKVVLFLAAVFLVAVVGNLTTCGVAKAASGSNYVPLQAAHQGLWNDVTRPGEGVEVWSTGTDLFVEVKHAGTAAAAPSWYFAVVPTVGSVQTVPLQGSAGSAFNTVGQLVVASDPVTGNLSLTYTVNGEAFDFDTVRLTRQAEPFTVCDGFSPAAPGC